MTIPIYPIKVSVVLLDGTTVKHEPATHFESEDGALCIYDGADIVKEYPKGSYDYFVVDELVPEVEDYKGEGFPI